MSIFSRGSKKRKDFVKNKMQKTNSETGEKYTDTEANEKYMKKKQEWAEEIIEGLKLYCNVLRDPQAIWNEHSKEYTGTSLFWDCQNATDTAINEVMNSNKYKNLTEGGSSSKYLQKAQFEIGKLIATNLNSSTDPENFKSSMQSCGKGLSKLKHPTGSTALVKVGKKGERIVDYVDELARLMLIKSVQANAAILVKLEKGAEWPIDDGNYTYEKVEPKYVRL